MSKNEEQILVANVHLASPAGAVADWRRFFYLYSHNFNVRCAQYEKVNIYLNKLRSSYPKQLLIGDLNTHRAEPLYNQLTNDWTDEYRSHHSLPGPTFPYAHKVKFPVLTLDYIMSRGAIRSENTFVVKAGSSDHCALKARLVF